MNFDFLKPFAKFEKLYNFCSEAEQFAQSHPYISIASARKANEFIVRLIYGSIYGEEMLATVNTFTMLTDPQVIDYIGDGTLLNSFHYIRKMGNMAAHADDSANITKNDSLRVLEELLFVVGETMIHIGVVEDYPVFSVPAVMMVATPTEPASEVLNRTAVNPSRELIAEYGPRMRKTKFDTRNKRDESENKKLFLYASLREAGWPIVNKPNQAMPKSVGINILLDDGDQIDYVLYGNDNKPLAIVEYTESSQNPLAGRQKAIKVAEQMCAKYGYKPIIYYTSGYYIFIIDQLGYKPRRVFQFHSIEELELLKLRATIRQDISNPVIDENITNRDYQKNAIRATCAAFSNNRRHSLLVMATGTGKTRIAISLVDILMKANWAKNVLFLADRTSLVRQAHKNFNKLLPSVTTSIYAGGGFDRDSNARIIFSTYQTMINLINDDTKEFGIGRFDLIIIDEAHRSIFKKYGALFHYFDALMVGLTATPRAEENKSTYKMFELPNGQPDYAYELEEAINDGFLVGFTVLDKTTDAMSRGVYYDDLSEEEKESFEEAFSEDDDTFGNDFDFSGTVVAADNFLKKKAINLGTIKAMLNDLMKNGLKIDGGDKIGKTIIFAGSHYEAERIVDCFQQLYPYLGMDFCKLIDSQVQDNLALIDSFGERNQLPQIAVSVDMMDTGIDVPDVLNLVFFKNMNSKIKFLQMIGRGTRLCPNIYGPGLDKTGFLIFDYYDNFRYFKTGDTWKMVGEDSSHRGMNIMPQSLILNNARFGILCNLTSKAGKNAFERKYQDELKDYFISSMRALNNDDLEVQYNMAYVSKYRTAEQWDSFSTTKEVEIEAHVLPLLPSSQDNVKVKNFDMLMLTIEKEVPRRIEENKDIRKIRYGFGNVGNKIDEMLVELLKLKTIPAVVKKEPLINQMRHADLIFDNFSLELCEKVRYELRDLMQYIPDEKKYYVIETKDFVIDPAGTAGGVAQEKSYPEKVHDYLNKQSTEIAKIRNLDMLTEEEKANLETIFTSKLGTAADYAAWAGNKALLPQIRTQVGIADEAIQTKFGTILNTDYLDDTQLTFMNQIIGYARENGDVTFMDLQKVSPFCDVDIMELFGAKINDIKTLINGLHKPVM